MLKKILVVEDDPDISEMITYVLQEEGYEVVLSEDGEACQHLLEILPDLILMDIRLKEAGANGDIICGRIKSSSETRFFRVVLLSAEFDLPALSKACGADGFISKPFNLGEFTETVRGLIR